MCRYKKLFPCLIFWLHDHKKIVCYGGVVVQQMTLSSIHVLQCPTHYCVQHFTVSSKILYPHLFLIYTSSTLPCQHAAVVSCFALLSPLLRNYWLCYLGIFQNVSTHNSYILNRNSSEFCILDFHYMQICIPLRKFVVFDFEYFTKNFLCKNHSIF